MRSRLLLGGALVLVVAGLWLGASTPDDEARAGIDIPLTFLDETSGNVADFQGKPVVLNFWASWCPACVAELPDFEQVHQNVGDDVVFIGMNMQEVDSEAAATLITQTGVTYLLAADIDGAIYRSLGGIAMPTSVFIDADGEVVDVHSGVIFAEDLEAKIRDELLS